MHGLFKIWYHSLVTLMQLRQPVIITVHAWEQAFFLNPCGSEATASLLSLAWEHTS